MSRNAPKRTSWPFAASLEGFGQNLFKGAVAAPYLKAQGLSTDILESHAWTTDGNAEKVRSFDRGPFALQALTFEICLQVAAAVLEWAKENDATMYTHWFQPMSGSGLRHGLTGQVHNSLLWFDTQNRPSWKFEAKNLLRGETDGSSFLNGGMRATHTAGAYIAIDPTSPLFIRNDTMFIPSCLVSYDGKALDEKVPLLRAGDALSREGVRLLKHLGFNVKSVVANIGLEQEFFLVPRESFNRRPDLQLAGRTVTGKKPPRGQELCDHCKYLFRCLLPSPPPFHVTNSWKY
jgi:glutamine synthetase